MWFSFANLSISRYISSLRPNVNHVLAELFITDEPVVNTQEIYLLAFLVERIRGEVLTRDPPASSRNGARGEPPFLM